jgi:hypothetical protein
MKRASGFIASMDCCLGRWQRLFDVDARRTKETTTTSPVAQWWSGFIARQIRIPSKMIPSNVAHVVEGW